MYANCMRDFRTHNVMPFSGHSGAIVRFVYVIVTNHENWHRENLRPDRANTGNLKMQFEWVPCTVFSVSGPLAAIHYCTTIY